mgnify:CR=1 FL=1
MISGTPEIAPSLRSSGAAMVAAIVSGSAPGRLADTRMVGKSTAGTLASGMVKQGEAFYQVIDPKPVAKPKPPEKTPPAKK